MEDQLLTDLLALLSEEELIRLCRRAHNAHNPILEQFLTDQLEQIYGSVPGLGAP